MKVWSLVNPEIYKLRYVQITKISDNCFVVVTLSSGYHSEMDSFKTFRAVKQTLSRIYRVDKSLPKMKYIEEV